MRTFWIIGLAALVAMLFLTFLAWSHRWDHPPAGGDAGTFSSIHWAGMDLPVTVMCIGCPNHLVVGRQRVLQFEATLTDRASLFKGKKIGLWYEAGGTANLKSDSEGGIWLSRDDQSGEVKGPLTLQVMPLDENFPGFVFHFTAWNVGADGKETGTPTQIGTVYLAVPAEPPAFQVIAPYLYAFMVFLAFMGAIFLVNRRSEEIKRKAEKKIADAQAKADEHPEKIRLSWELAQVKLQAYFDRNLDQVKLVFFVAVAVMIVGFTLVFAGVLLSFHDPKTWTTSLVAAISGIITQFIGATFMVIYRSTMSQANDYMMILERINSVGMAVQVVESLQGQTELQNATRAAIAKLLLGGGKATSDKPRGSGASAAQKRAAAGP